MAKAKKQEKKSYIPKDMSIDAFEDGNVYIDFEDGLMIIEVDVSEALGDTKTGKSISIATTHGNKSIPGTDLMIGLNVIVPYYKIKEVNGKKKAVRKRRSK